MKTLRNRVGFTLVEILVVIVIIGILSGIVLKLHTLVGERAARAQTLARIENIKMCLEEYYREHGSYPPESSSPIDHGTECLGFRLSALADFPDHWEDIIRDYPEYAASPYTGLIYYIECNTDLVLAGQGTWPKRWKEYYSAGVGFNDWDLRPGTVSIPGFDEDYTNVNFRLLDSWYQEFVYTCREEDDYQSFDLYSRGPTGNSGDDIGRVGMGE